MFDGLTGVDPDADPKRKVRVALVVRFRPPRDAQCAPHRITWGVEHEVEAVAFGLDLDSPLGTDLCAHDRPVRAKQPRRRGIAASFYESRVVTKIGEEIRSDDTTRHARIVPAAQWPPGNGSAAGGAPPWTMFAHGLFLELFPLARAVEVRGDRRVDECNEERGDREKERGRRGRSGQQIAA